MKNTPGWMTDFFLEERKIANASEGKQSVGVYVDSVQKLARDQEWLSSPRQNFLSGKTAKISYLANDIATNAPDKKVRGY